jgi:hypothetical protein
LEWLAPAMEQRPQVMIAVTTRSTVRERLEAVSATVGLPRPCFSETLYDALESGVDSPLLLLDLGSCCRDADLAHALHTWEAFRPGSEVVLFTPLIDQAAELRAAVTLARATRFVETRVMTASEFNRDEIWHSLYQSGERAALQAEIRSELLTTLRRAGHQLRGEAVVLQILRDSSSLGEASGRAERLSVKTEKERKALWKLLRRARQIPASRLLLIFRVLWYAKLVERGWHAGRIAHFLGFGSARQFRVMMKGRLGLGIEQLKRIRYDAALEWAASLLAGGADSPQSPNLPMRAVIQPLVEKSDGTRMREMPVAARQMAETSMPAGTAAP